MACLKMEKFDDKYFYHTQNESTPYGQKYILSNFDIKIILTRLILALELNVSSNCIALNPLSRFNVKLLCDKLQCVFLTRNILL